MLGVAVVCGATQPAGRVRGWRHTVRQFRRQTGLPSGTGGHCYNVQWEEPALRQSDYGRCSVHISRLLLPGTSRTVCVGVLTSRSREAGEPPKLKACSFGGQERVDGQPDNSHLKQLKRTRKRPRAPRATKELKRRQRDSNTTSTLDTSTAS